MGGFQLFSKNDFLYKKDTKEMLKSCSEVFNIFFSNMGVDFQPNIIVATLNGTVPLHSESTSIDDINIMDSQGNYDIYEKLVNREMPAKIKLSERGEIIKNLTIEVLNNHYTTTENNSYYYYMDHADLKRNSNQLLHRIILVEANGESLNRYKDKRYFETVMKSINQAYLDERSYLLDGMFSNSGRRLLNQFILKDITSSKEEDKQSSIFDNINNLSLLKYEGSENSGKILFCEHSELEEAILLKDAVELSNYRGVRKLLETTRRNLYLICDGYRIVGFLDSSNGLVHSEKVVVINFRGLGQWELEQPLNTPIMSVEYGVPSMPKVSISEDDFASKFEKVFEDSDYCNAWSLVNSAKHEEHGTMVVIVEDAYKEVQRLQKQSFPIKSLGKINSSNIKDFTTIDGAILIDTKGVCHAIGVILDGEAAAAVGDMSRGARYNSALKYLNASKKDKRKCLIVIISEDGMINIKTEDDLN